MKVFLGGTCAKSASKEPTWRERLIPMLRIDYFDPVVDDWNETAMAREVLERSNSDFCLYVITPEMTGVYAIAEVVDDSNKRPDKTVLVILSQYGGCAFSDGQWKSLRQVGSMVLSNGGRLFGSLEEAAGFFNGERGKNANM
jgi:hypothetical protein